MNHVYSHLKAERSIAIILLVLVLSQLLASCMAVTYTPTIPNQIVLINGNSVAMGVFEALQGTAGTYIFQNGDKYLFAWSYADKTAMGFWAIDMRTKQAVDVTTHMLYGGKIASLKTVQEMIDAAVEMGWKLVTPQAMAGEAFWNIAAGACSVLNRVPILLLYSVDTNADGFLDWYEQFYPSMNT